MSSYYCIVVAKLSLSFWIGLQVRIQWYVIQIIRLYKDTIIICAITLITSIQCSYSILCLLCHQRLHLEYSICYQFSESKNLVILHVYTVCSHSHMITYLLATVHQVHLSRISSAYFTSLANLHLQEQECVSFSDRTGVIVIRDPIIQGVSPKSIPLHANSI